MKIRFDKIGATPKTFEVRLGDATLSGTLQKSGYHRVTLDAVMGGKVALDCDRCAQSYEQPLEGKLKLTISDQMIEDKDDLDIIEFLDGNIDLTYILESEINALKGAYHYCSNCDNGEADFEMEF
ncbi:MAG: YceD family protein [Sulfurovum sp.]